MHRGQLDHPLNGEKVDEALTGDPATSAGVQGFDASAPLNEVSGLVASKLGKCSIVGAQQRPFQANGLPRLDMTRGCRWCLCVSTGTGPLTCMGMPGHPYDPRDCDLVQFSALAAIYHVPVRLSHAAFLLPSPFLLFSFCTSHTLPPATFYILTLCVLSTTSYISLYLAVSTCHADLAETGPPKVFSCFLPPILAQYFLLAARLVHF
jgi:hypothetical protein